MVNPLSSGPTDREEAPAPGAYTPLYESQHFARYERQRMIRQYQQDYDCNLIVVSGPIFAWTIVFFEELIHQLSDQRDLHVMLVSPGGDGETALRMVRSAQLRCKELVVVIPDQAKSAATLFALGSNRILMGPFSDLGPIDPQFQFGAAGELVSAKDIIATVDQATKKVQDAPETYPLWASMLSNITALMVQQAQAGMGRSSALLRAALAANTKRTEQEVDNLVTSLQGKLIEEAQTHAAVFGADDALAAGLPVVKLNPAETIWKDTWRVWTRYVSLSYNSFVFEGERASQIFAMGGLASA